MTELLLNTTSEKESFTYIKLLQDKKAKDLEYIFYNL